MNIFLYTIIFIMGIVFGSFYTLAVYRIPLKQDITHTRSYCPKCNHKLNFLDLIPVLSYIFLKGKCRYCKEKIRPRYLILELASGLAFLLFALLLKIDLYNMQYTKFGILIFGFLFFTAIIINIGIFKEYKRIEKSVFNYGIIVEMIYMIYLYILNTSIYRYVIYLPILLLMLLINNKCKRENIRLICFAIFIIIGILEILIML